MSQSSVKVYDTTLRDGMQGEKISFTLEEKLEIAKRLDDLGLNYIEGGFPLSNKKEEKFFRKVKDHSFKNAKIAAFGSTRRPGGEAHSDININALLDAETPVVTVVGKSWTRHVTEVIRSTLEENIAMIRDSVSYLKKEGREVVYDAEHFFDGFADKPEYALESIRAAHEAGADVVVLCDTNGGTIHSGIIQALEKAKAEIPGINLGIHLHNDVGMAVANSIISVEYGCTHIQGTLNGWGERCGNANLCSIIPNLHYKMNQSPFTDEQVRELTNVARYAAELANIIPDERQPYIGRSAFAHKAGQHADVIIKNPELMEHMDSNLVGNERRVLLSELAGKSTIVHKMKTYGEFSKNSREVDEVTQKLKENESLGLEYEAAEASFDLVIRRVIGRYKEIFTLLHYEVESFRTGQEGIKTLARIRMMCNERIYTGYAVSKGPVGALDKAIRAAMSSKYPFLEEIKLVDYKVRVLNGEKATGASVRVFIKSSDRKSKWDTVGVSENIIEASYQALIDSYEYVYNNKILEEA